MDEFEIESSRVKLNNFLNSNRTKFAFRIKCDLKDRIDYIYAVIFPGKQLFFFYLRFVLGRIAEKIDYSPIKVFLYRLMGVKIGEGVFISPSVIIDPHFPKLITIEDYVILGYGARIAAHEQTGMTYYIGRVTIKKGATVGGYASIRRGSTIPEMADVPALTNIHSTTAKQLKSETPPSDNINNQDTK